jgi:hypothetical protein
MYRILLFSILVVLSNIAAGQAKVDTIIDGVSYYEKRSYTATKTSLVPKIDGRLDDACWEQGLWTGQFTQYNPDEGSPPSQQSEFKVLYDYNNIYVAFICQDSLPEKMLTKYNSRDIFSGDMIGIAFDSYFDKKTAYEFVLTSAGQKIDLKHIGDYLWDLNWNAVWDGATLKSDSGWAAEMTIPLSQLRYIDQPEQVWGLHSWRWIDRGNEESNWHLLPRNAPSIVDQFGIMHGVKDIKPSRQVEFSPYASVKFSPENENTRIPDAPYRPTQFGGGLDTKIGISSNMVLDLTINPDFGQVEADPSELNLTSYETFFDEKRPFFLEGRDIFDFKMAESQMFYSRRIGQGPQYVPGLNDGETLKYPQQTNILGAAKITGKTRNGLSIGIIESLTARAFATISSPDTLYDKNVSPHTNYAVGRIKKEYNDANTIIGGMFTSANKFINDNYLEDQLYNNAFSGGLDFIHYFNNKVYFIEGKSVVSSITGSEESISHLGQQYLHGFQRPDADHLTLDTTLTSMVGSGGGINLGKQGGKWRYSAGASWSSPSLELNDLGYLRQADMISENLTASYVITEPKGAIRDYSIQLDQNAAGSFGGELIDSKVGISFKTGFMNLWKIFGGAGRDFATLDPRVLRGGPALATNPLWRYVGKMGTSRAKDISFTASFEQAVNEDKLYNYRKMAAGILWLPIDRIRLNTVITHTKFSQNQQYILETSPGSEPIYLMGSLDQKILNLTLRAQLFITPELSLEYYGSPYLSMGDYSVFKKVSDPHSRDYTSRFYEYQSHEIEFDDQDNTYLITDPEEGEFEFTNPDFNFAQFRSNLVFRWEYKLGSVFYFVWSHEQTHDELTSRMDQGDNIANLIGTPSKNVFMVKFNYWFTL